MSSTSHYNTGSTPSLPGRRIIVENVESPTATIVNLSVDLINGLPPPSAPPISAAVNSILTVVSAGVADFSSDATVDNLDVLDDLKLDGDSGTTGQVIKKNGATQEWSDIIADDITPGLANQVFTTNSTGTLSKWSSDVSVDDNLIFNGIYGAPGQFVKKKSGGQEWKNLVIADITAGTNGQIAVTSGGVSAWGNCPVATIVPGTNGQVITTTGGVSSWGTCPPGSITPGTAYQVPQTNSAATGVEWTSTLGVDSILLTGGASVFQSTFDRYYSSNVFLPVYATASGGTPSVYQLFDALAFYTIIGKRVDMTIMPFTINTLVGGSPNPCYISLQILPSILSVKNLRDADALERQSTCMCSISQNTTTQANPAFCNAYTDYYGLGGSYLEIVANNSGNFVSNGYHGGPFVAGLPEFMSIKAPFTISYITD